jgi:hypothetical protein
VNGRYFEPPYYINFCSLLLLLISWAQIFSYVFFFLTYPHSTHIVLRQSITCWALHGVIHEEECNTIYHRRGNLRCCTVNGSTSLWARTYVLKSCKVIWNVDSYTSILILR